MNTSPRKEDLGNSACMFAVRHRKLAMLQFIFQRDGHHIAADTRDDKDGRTALMVASVKGQIDIF
jgi:ankyrin repeat protein